MFDYEKFAQDIRDGLKLAEAEGRKEVAASNYSDEDKAFAVQSLAAQSYFHEAQVVYAVALQKCRDGMGPSLAALAAGYFANITQSNTVGILDKMDPTGGLYSEFVRGFTGPDFGDGTVHTGTATLKEKAN